MVRLRGGKYIVAPGDFDEDGNEITGIFEEPPKEKVEKKRKKKMKKRKRAASQMEDDEELSSTDANVSGLEDVPPPKEP